MDGLWSARRGRLGQAPPLIPIFVVVLTTDQAAKWVAWRHFDGTLINEGGFIALRPGVRAWFAAPTGGAVANAVGVLLVLAGIAWLLRRQRSAPVLLGGGLVAAGWTSNLLDRFGLHAWTAPGSVRGVVDFIPSGGVSRSNIADVWILVGLTLLVWALLKRAAPPASGSTRTAPARGESGLLADGELDVAVGVDAGVQQLVVE